MTSTMYIKLNSDGTYTELTEAEFKSSPGANAATQVSISQRVLTAKNPDIEKTLDPQTPQISARRTLQTLFPFLPTKTASELAFYMLDFKKTLFILK